MEEENLGYTVAFVCICRKKQKKPSSSSPGADGGGGTEWGGEQQGWERDFPSIPFYIILIFELCEYLFKQLGLIYKKKGERKKENLSPNGGKRILPAAMSDEDQRG